MSLKANYTTALIKNKNDVMKLWDKGFSIDKKIEHFTVGNDREIDIAYC